MTWATFVVSLLSLFAAGVAAFYAFKAFQAFQGARAKDVKPRPQFSFVAPPGGNGLLVSAVNAGGAVAEGCVVIRFASSVQTMQGPRPRFNLYKATIALGAHSTNSVMLPLLGETSAPGGLGGALDVLVNIAQDVEGNWWDVHNDDRLDVRWASTKADDCVDWINGHLPARANGSSEPWLPPATS